jgi:hypothetical protein
MTAEVSVNSKIRRRKSTMSGGGGVRRLLWILPCVIIVYRMMKSPGKELRVYTKAWIFESNSMKRETAATRTTNRTAKNNTQKLVYIADTFGSYDDVTGRLVVQTNETHMFWDDGQKRLCRVLRQTTGAKVVGADDAPKRSALTPLLKMTVECVGMANNTWFGQGNWVSAFYVVRMAAALANVDFQFQCLNPNYNSSEPNLLLPLLQGYFPAPTPPQRWPYDGKLPKANEVCTYQYRKIRIDKMSHQIQKDMRKIAMKVVGGEDPMYPPNNITLDDVAIHFRCGDVLGGASRNDFGMIPFREYKKRIFRNATSIGILTQPFTPEDNRDVDQDQAAQCEIVVRRLVEYLQDFMPNGTIIRIQNDPVTETLPLAWARLTLARQQAFTTLSSFGIFPVIGTLGQGYFQKGNNGINPWATHVPKHLPNIHEMTGPVMGTYDIGTRIRKKGLKSMITWFVAEEEE